MKRRYWVIIIVIILLLTGGLFAGGLYFYQMAVVPSHKSFISNQNIIKRSDPLYHQKKWFQQTKKQHWTMQSATGHLKLVADYVPAKVKTNRTVLIAHGFMGNKESMGAYAYLFHQLGYNVLAPDARGQGHSQGNYIGYGWPDRLDDKKWINRIISANGQKSKIVMFGVSMGGATTMMTSGEKLPSQVKVFVEDCGYTDVKQEISYQAKEMYNLPSFPLVDVVSLITRVRAGYFFGSASSVNQLAHNKRPMLFIHGAKDTFVPTKMVYQNYHATKGPKQLWIVKNAQHAKSYVTAPKAYQQHISQFLDKYMR
ncbi:alpha/beta hydrolase [Paucilactobacillus hokkaidonensis JCM 18461]|uniref:Alpha/beta hydrolase n=1 Tax=Paucilactobacillus hokkaidonensis JCM 18461 TaxID=1291742 RepID=A0A0A1GZS5_9LACO|nr:alpha/beta hydrolase [Paucilactobacillus hokkaidonensis]BAP86499.1 alpha/beta hydrolase [Paucilactobacillus hokkaidonensis JCM 18461]